MRTAHLRQKQLPSAQNRTRPGYGAFPLLVMDTYVCTAGVDHVVVAPVKAVQRERAGRVKGATAAKRTLDAPKRSRKIERRSDGNTWELCPGIRPTVRHNSASFPTLVSGKTAASPTHDFTEHQTPPQHIIDADVWGVSDPAGRARGRIWYAQAGSLTPHSCCYTCAGSRRAAQTAARPDRAVRRQHRLVQRIATSRRPQRCPRPQ